MQIFKQPKAFRLNHSVIFSALQTCLQKLLPKWVQSHLVLQDDASPVIPAWRFGFPGMEKAWMYGGFTLKFRGAPQMLDGL